MSTKTSCKKAREEFKSTESKFLKCKVQSSKSQRIEPCYPIKKLRAFFTAKMISGILNCRCEKCSQKYPEVRESAEAIQGKENESYISVFAFLYKLKRLQLIHKFLSNKYTDQGLSNPEFIQKHFTNSSDDCILSEQDFNDLFESNDYWEYQAFFQFFIPALHYSHRLHHRSIPNDQLPPFNIIRKIGEGGYSVVYEALMLDGYHDFQGITDGRVAIKQYSDTLAAGKDCDKEMINNVRCDHPRIMPLQAAIDHRGTYMHIYPFAEDCLQTMLKKDPSERYKDNPEHVWEEFMGLSSAVHHIHANTEATIGYHFDLKPHNILLYRGKWTITDLGLAHHKAFKASETAPSATTRKIGNDEYGPPERPIVNRSYDIFSLGAIGCDVLVWSTEGVDALAKFRDPGRKSEKIIPGETKEILYNFYNDDEQTQDLKPAVQILLQGTIIEGGLLGEVSSILQDMLSYDRQKRPTAKVCEIRFAEALGLEVPADEPLPATNLEVQNGTLQVPGPIARARRLSQSRPAHDVFPVVSSGSTGITLAFPTFNNKDSGYDPSEGDARNPNEALSPATDHSKESPRPAISLELSYIGSGEPVNTMDVPDSL